MSSGFLTAALTCDSCEAMQSFAQIDDDGEVNIDLALGNATDGGWVVTVYKGQYTTTCDECVAWERHND